MDPTVNTPTLNAREIECPSCRQTVSPIREGVCPVCGEGLSLLLALRKVIDRLRVGAQEVAITAGVEPGGDDA